MPCNTPALVLLHRLTNARRMWEAGLPLTRQGVADAFAVPHTVKRAVVIVFASHPASGLSSGRGYILAEHVPMFVRLGRPCLGRGACSVFFCALKTLKQDRYPMTNTHSPAVNGHELTPNTATAATCRRAFRRRSALRLPEDRAEQLTMPEGSAFRADRPTAAPAPSLYAEALAARDALQRAAAGLTAYRQSLADLRRVGYALLPRLCADEGYASPIARPFIGDVLDTPLSDAEQQLTDGLDKASAQASLLCRLAREVEKAGEVCHA